MSLPFLGETRSTRRTGYLLPTPDTFVRAALPGMINGVAVVHASHQLGAGFTQYTAELELDGRLGRTLSQRFIYVLEGHVELDIRGERHTLIPGAFAYAPQGI